MYIYINISYIYMFISIMYPWYCPNISMTHESKAQGHRVRLGRRLRLCGAPAKAHVGCVSVLAGYDREQ
jgi:hypothetical protein